MYSYIYVSWNLEVQNYGLDNHVKIHVLTKKLRIPQLVSFFIFLETLDPFIFSHSFKNWLGPVAGRTDPAGKWWGVWFGLHIGSAMQLNRWKPVTQRFCANRTSQRPAFDRASIYFLKNFKNWHEWDLNPWPTTRQRNLTNAPLVFLF